MPPKGSKQPAAQQTPSKEFKEQLDKLEMENSKLADSLSAQEELVKELTEEIDGLKDEKKEFQAALAEAKEQHKTGDIHPQEYDPVLLAHCVGILRNSLTQGPMKEAEAQDMAKKFADQAKVLYRELVNNDVS